MINLLKTIAQNRVFANIIFIVVLMAGGVAVSQMIKEDLPVMADDMVEVSMVWEGADPASVEEGILRKIEMATQGMEGVKDIRTIAVQNLGKAVFIVESGYDPQQVLDRVKTRVNAISGFPKDTEKPVIERPSHSFAVMTLYINGHITEKRLKRTGIRIKEELQRLEAVSQVELDGARAYEIGVEVSLSTLRQYGLEIKDIADIISQNSLELSAGDISRKDRRFTIRTMGKKTTADQIGRIIAVTSPAGEQIPLARIAKITDGFVQAAAEVRINGKPGVLINIYKNEKEDAVNISKAVRLYVMDQQKRLDPNIEFDILFDASVATVDRISSLLRNGCYGLLIVLAVLWIFIDARLAFWVAAGIPFSILGGLAVLWLCGGTLNMVSLFSLIMVLGIIADDAIVVGEAILYHRKNGAAPLDAVATGVKEVGIPVLVAVVTSVMAFLPLLFIPGMMGKFIAILPVTVIACLIISLLECFILLPSHLNTDPAKRSKINRKLNVISDRVGRLLDGFVDRIYTPFLGTALKHRYVTISSSVSLLLITAGIMLGGFLPFDLFPDTQGNVITATVEFPVGTGIQTTGNAVAELEKALSLTVSGMTDHSGNPILLNRMGVSGHLLGDEAGEIEESDPRFGSVQAVLVPASTREEQTFEILDRWQTRLGDIPGARMVNFFTDNIGMAEAPIVIHLMGEDLEELARAADAVREWLESFEAVFQVRSDLAEKNNEFQLSLKDSARALGISLSDMAQQVKDGYFGRKSVTIQRGQEEVDVYVRLSKREREIFSSLEQMRIKTASDSQVPLSVVADVENGFGVSRIERKNRLRKVSISAYVRGQEATADQIMDRFEESYIPVFKNRFPGIEIAEGGDEEEENMTFDSLLYGFPLIMFVIYMIIAATFKSYVKPLIVLLVIPFGMAGAVLGHLILGHMLSLMSVFGMVAITGVLINDAIVLMDSIAAHTSAQRAYEDAVKLGSKRRFRAVLLTSVSTIAGLIPLILEQNPHIQLLIPMAVSIVGGIGASTVITLVLVPGFMMILNDFQNATGMKTAKA